MRINLMSIEGSIVASGQNINAPADGFHVVGADGVESDELNCEGILATLEIKHTFNNKLEFAVDQNGFCIDYSSVFADYTQLISKIQATIDKLKAFSNTAVGDILCVSGAMLLESGMYTEEAAESDRMQSDFREVEITSLEDLNQILSFVKSNGPKCRPDLIKYKFGDFEEEFVASLPSVTLKPKIA